MAYGPNSSHGRPWYPQRRRTDSNRSANEGGGQPLGGNAEIGRDRAVRQLASGNTAADKPPSLAGRPRRPCPVGWGRAGNGRTRHGLRKWAPASETPGLSAGTYLRREHRACPLPDPPGLGQRGSVPLVSWRTGACQAASSAIKVRARSPCTVKLRSLDWQGRTVPRPLTEWEGRVAPLHLSA